MCFCLSVYPHWRSMVTKQFIAPIQGSAAAADPLEGQVPLVVHIISDGLGPTVEEDTAPKTDGKIQDVGAGYTLRFLHGIVRRQ